MKMPPRSNQASVIIFIEILTAVRPSKNWTSGVFHPGKTSQDPISQCLQESQLEIGWLQIQT